MVNNVDYGELYIQGKLPPHTDYYVSYENGHNKCDYNIAYYEGSGKWSYDVQEADNFKVIAPVPSYKQTLQMVDLLRRLRPNISVSHITQDINRETLFLETLEVIDDTKMYDPTDCEFVWDRKHDCRTL